MTNVKKRNRLNDPDTKAKILKTAKDVFAETGYARASIRDIATRAGISSALLFRYFGSKSELFEAALIAASDLEFVLENTSIDDIGSFVTAVAKNPEIKIRVLEMLTLAIGDQESRDIAIRVAQEKIVPALGAWLGPPNGEVKATQILMMFMGFNFYTRYIPLPPKDEPSDKQLTDWAANVIQDIVE